MAHIYCGETDKGFLCTLFPGHGGDHAASTGYRTVHRWPNAMNNSVPSKTEAQKRKTYPMFEGLMKYFPDALAEVANVSFVGNEQHNPGQPLHWDRSKSTDEDDAMLRHVKDRAKGIVFDTDGVRHRAKAAWRALAALQKEIEESENAESGHQKRVA